MNGNKHCLRNSAFVASSIYNMDSSDNEEKTSSALSASFDYGAIRGKGLHTTFNVSEC